MTCGRMNSCLYECSVMHARFSPRPHRFLYRIFLFAIDLDELPLLHRTLALFSFGRRNLYSFRDGDYLPTGEALHHPPLPPATSAAPPPQRTSETGNLKARVLAHLAASSPTLDLTGARVVLVTLPRVFGYLFNPVSFYFCYDRTGTPVAALSEVTNTFKEMKPYVLGPATRTNATPSPEARPSPSAPPNTSTSPRFQTSTSLSTLPCARRAKTSRSKSTTTWAPNAPSPAPSPAPAEHSRARAWRGLR